MIMARYQFESIEPCFIETNHRNPSKYALEEKLMVHFNVEQTLF